MKRILSAFLSATLVISSFGSTMPNKVYAVSSEAEQYETIDQMTQDQNLDKYFAEMTINVENNEVVVDGQSSSLVETIDVSSQEESTILQSEDSLESYFEETNYEVEKTDDNEYVITAPYQTKRILVVTSKLTEDCGAIKIGNNNNTYLLEFANEEATKIAYEKLQTVYGESNVILDEVIQVKLEGISSSEWTPDFNSTYDLYIKTSASINNNAQAANDSYSNIYNVQYKDDIVLNVETIDINNTTNTNETPVSLEDSEVVYKWYIQKDNEYVLLENAASSSYAIDDIMENCRILCEVQYDFDYKLVNPDDPSDIQLYPTSLTEQKVFIINVTREARDFSTDFSFVLENDTSKADDDISVISNKILSQNNKLIINYSSGYDNAKLTINDIINSKAQSSVLTENPNIYWFEGNIDSDDEIPTIENLVVDDAIATGQTLKFNIELLKEYYQYYCVIVDKYDNICYYNIEYVQIYPSTFDRELTRINTTQNIVKQLNALPNKETVTVAVLDTGFTTSDDFTWDVINRLDLDNSKNFLDGDDEEILTDSCNTLHGTHIVDIIASSTPDNVKIKIYKVFGQNNTTSISTLYNAFDAAYNTADIINCSWTFKVDDSQKSLLEQALNKLLLNEQIIVAAAGNEANASDFPVGYSTNNASGEIKEVIGVGTINTVKAKTVVTETLNGNKVSSVLYPSEVIVNEAYVDFTAPGIDIINNNIQIGSGSSYASPSIAAAYAIIKTCDLQNDTKQISTSNELTQQLKKYVDKDFEIFNRYGDYKTGKYGYGYLNFYEARICDCNDDLCKILWHITDEHNREHYIGQFNSNGAKFIENIQSYVHEDENGNPKNENNQTLYSVDVSYYDVTPSLATFYRTKTNSLIDKSSYDYSNELKTDDYGETYYIVLTEQNNGTNTVYVDKYNQEFTMDNITIKEIKTENNQTQKEYRLYLDTVYKYMLKTDTIGPEYIDIEDDTLFKVNKNNEKASRYDSIYAYQAEIDSKVYTHIVNSDIDIIEDETTNKTYIEVIPTSEGQEDMIIFVPLIENKINDNNTVYLFEKQTVNGKENTYEVPENYILEPDVVRSLTNKEVNNNAKYVAILFNDQEYETETHTSAITESDYVKSIYPNAVFNFNKKYYITTSQADYLLKVQENILYETNNINNCQYLMTTDGVAISEDYFNVNNIKYDSTLKKFLFEVKLLYDNNEDIYITTKDTSLGFDVINKSLYGYNEQENDTKTDYDYYIEKENAIIPQFMKINKKQVVNTDNVNLVEWVYTINNEKKSLKVSDIDSDDGVEIKVSQDVIFDAVWDTKIVYVDFNNFNNLTKSVSNNDIKEGNTIRFGFDVQKKELVSVSEGTINDYKDFIKSITFKDKVLTITFADNKNEYLNTNVLNNIPNDETQNSHIIGYNIVYNAIDGEINISDEDRLNKLDKFTQNTNTSSYVLNDFDSLSIYVNPNTYQNETVCVINYYVISDLFDLNYSSQNDTDGLINTTLDISKLDIDQNRETYNKYALAINLLPSVFENSISMTTDELTELVNTTKAYGDNIELSIPSSVAGYKFINWIEENTNEVSKFITITKNNKYITKYEKLDYIVKFKDYDKFITNVSVLEDQLLKFKEIATEPNVILDDKNRTLLGFFANPQYDLTDDTLTLAPFDFDTPIEKNYTLYATFDYKVTLEDEDTYVLPGCKVYFKEDIDTRTTTAFKNDTTGIEGISEIHLEQPVKEGYDFKGWDINGVVYNSSSDVDYATISKDTIIKPVFAEKTYTVIYMLNGNEVYRDTAKDKAINATYTLYKPDLDDKYDFDGWYSKEGDGAILLPDFEAENPYEIDNMLSEDNASLLTDYDYDAVTRTLTLYATTTVPSFTIQFHAALFDGENYVVNNDYDSSTTYQQAEKAELKDLNIYGYDFVGYYVDNNDMDNELTTITNLEDLTKIEELVMTENTTVYRIYTPKTFKVNYIVNKVALTDEEIAEYGLDTEITFNEEVELKLPNRENYTFDGWYNASNVKIGKFTATNEIVVYGKFNVIPFEISFIDNVTKQTVENLMVYDSQQIEIDGLVDPEDKYIFTGWYTEDNGQGTQITYTNELECDTTLYANWARAHYYITTYINGEYYDTIRIDYNQLKTLEALDVLHYIFDGWYDADGNYVETVINEDLSIYGTLTAQKYTITFEGYDYSPIIAEYDQEITLPEVPEGMTSWHDKAGNYYYDTLKVQGDLTLSCADESKSYTYKLTFVDEKYNKTVNNIYIDYEGSTPVYPKNAKLPVLYENGDTFMGWYDQSGYKVETAYIGRSTTLFAKWSGEGAKLYEYTVSFVDNVKQNEVDDVLIQYQEGEEKVIAPVELTADDNTIFLGWYTEDGTKVTNLCAFTSDVTLYAKWEVPMFNVEFIVDGETVDTQEVALGTDAIAPTITKDGYTITWDADFTNIQKDLTVTGTWTPNLYKVYFKANGGYGAMSAQKLTYDTSATLKANTFKRTDYTFMGWATSPTGEVVYEDVEEVKNLTTETKIYLYAKWTPTINTTSVKFYSNYDDNAYISKTIAENSTFDELPAIVREGYIFSQWNTAADGSGTKLTTTTPIKAGDEFYAIWIEEPKPATIKISNPSKGKLTVLASSENTMKVFYEYQYSSNSTFRTYVRRTSASPILTVSNLPLNTTQYVRVRSYIVVNGVRHYSEYSNAQAIRLINTTIE